MAFSIVGVLNDYLKEKDKERREKDVEHFHASWLGSCKRKQIYKRTNTPETNPICERVLKIFSVGDLFHWWLQKLCEDAGVLIAKEQEIIDERYNYKGRFDALVEKDGERILYDFKTKHSRYFDYLEVDGIPERYKMQVSSYAILGKLKVKEARILVISKDDLRMMEFPVKVEDYKDKVLMELIELNKYYKNLELPPRLEEEKDGKPNWECRFCEYKDLCRGKNWEDKFKKKKSKYFKKEYGEKKQKISNLSS